MGKRFPTNNGQGSKVNKVPKENSWKLPSKLFYLETVLDLTLTAYLQVEN